MRDHNHRVISVYIYTIYTWKSVYRVWSDFWGVYRVRVYTGFRGGVYRVNILKFDDFEAKIISKCSKIKGNPSQNVQEAKKFSACGGQAKNKIKNIVL